MRARDLAGSAELMLLGKAGASDAQLVDAATAQVLLLSSKYGLRSETLDLLGGGTMRWMDGRAAAPTPAPVPGWMAGTDAREPPAALVLSKGYCSASLAAHVTGGAHELLLLAASIVSKSAAAEGVHVTVSD
ncbi:hypothetical protein FOA52_000713 [Chlamydomonas sp. UWO 241]|nr:hypothetical protein FOA52_000713 [Chlamydomonas sp. UWO 241]